MDLGDVYQIKVICALTGGQESVQNWYYRCSVSAEGADADNVWDGFYTKLGSLYAGLMDESYELDRYQVINGMDNDDFEEGTPADDGLMTGGQLPTWLTASIRSGRQGPGFRHSHRGLPFGNVTMMDPNNGIWSSAMISAMQTFIDAARDEIIVFDGAEVEPVQLSGGFILGTSPVVSQVLTGPWEFNAVPSGIRTRQNYSWA